MKVHVLGYWGTYPAPGEATTGFLVETDREKVLLDCGSGVLAQLFKVCEFGDLTAVVITHHHHDHTADLGVLGYRALLARRSGERSTPLPVYMPEGPADLMREFEEEPLIDLQRIDESSKLQIGGLAVSFARTQHPVYCLACRFEYRGQVFVFSADSSECDGLRRIAEGADLFLCEANMFNGQEESARQFGHLTAGQAGALAREAGVRHLALTHYPHYGDIHTLVAQAAAAFGRDVIRLSTLQTLKIDKFQ
jgi:ribonuclease BN (tRNA processing enzyme)